MTSGKMELRATATIAVGLLAAGFVVLRVSHRNGAPVPEAPAAVSASMTAPMISASASATASAAKPSAQSTAFYRGHTPPYKELTELGRALFADTSLSANGDRSCQTCHSPAFAYGPPTDAPAGRRAIPSLRYLAKVPAFDLHHIEEDGSDSGPTGGLMWDGRARSEHEQARLPLLSDSEMGNRNDETLAGRIRASKSAPQIEKVFGEKAFESDASTIRTVLLSLETFEGNPPDFAPYSSKFDEVLRKKAALSEGEERGRQLYERKDKGNCASCHVSRLTEQGYPLFSDWGVIALGVPSKAGAPPDRGACEREDLKDHPELCGAFRTPSLRNTATRDRYFHNGAVKNLKDVVRFYATRDSNPARWEPADHENENMDPPFGKKTPALSEAEMDDIVTFLGTLNDGWRP